MESKCRYTHLLQSFAGRATAVSRAHQLFRAQSLQPPSPDGQFHKFRKRPKQASFAQALVGSELRASTKSPTSLLEHWAREESELWCSLHPCLSSVLTGQRVSLQALLKQGTWKRSSLHPVSDSACTEEVSAGNSPACLNTASTTHTVTHTLTITPPMHVNRGCWYWLRSHLNHYERTTGCIFSYLSHKSLLSPLEI